MKPSEFELIVREFLIKEWGLKLQKKKVKIGESEKEFDFVSDDGECIGDAKYYKNTPTGVPSAKLSTICEYAWLLQNTGKKRKFLIFGNDKLVPILFLSRWQSLVQDIEFYFFDGHTLERLN
jgi:hypothetical protein